MRPTGPAPEMPAATGRLFDAPPDLERDADEVIERVLENGDDRDLAWLAERYGERALGDWLGGRGGRRLSHRSRVFWSRVLEREPSPVPPLAAELWPQ